MKSELETAEQKLDEALDELNKVKSDAVELTHAKSHIKTAIR